MEREEVWLRAWCSMMVAPPEIKDKCVDMADLCLAEFDKRFPKTATEISQNLFAAVDVASMKHEALEFAESKIKALTIENESLKDMIKRMDESMRDTRPF